MCTLSTKKIPLLSCGDEVLWNVGPRLLLIIKIICTKKQTTQFQLHSISRHRLTGIRRLLKQNPESSGWD